MSEWNPQGQYKIGDIILAPAYYTFWQRIIARILGRKLPEKAQYRCVKTVSSFIEIEET